MKIQVLSVSGIAEALYGLGLSYGATKPIGFPAFEYAVDIIRLEESTYNCQSYALDVANQMITRANTNAPMGLGHSKFLESIDVQFLITAPRFWWQEMDTYRLATKQSDSTMHTLMSESKDSQELRNALCSNFLIPINDKDNQEDFISCGTMLTGLYNNYVQFCNMIHAKNLSKTTKKLFLKHALPEAFPNTRQEKLTYSSLRNIYHQRKNHELPHWHKFCDVIKELPFSEWITSD